MCMPLVDPKTFNFATEDTSMPVVLSVAHENYWHSLSDGSILSETETYARATAAEYLEMAGIYGRKYGLTRASTDLARCEAYRTAYTTFCEAAKDYLPIGRPRCWAENQPGAFRENNGPC